MTPEEFWEAIRECARCEYEERMERIRAFERLVEMLMEARVPRRRRRHASR